MSEAYQSFKAAARKLGERVRQLRVHAQLSQATLALRAGIAVETLARIERAPGGSLSSNENPTFETLTKLARALGVEIVELFTTSAEPKPSDPLDDLLQRASSAERKLILTVVDALLREGRPRSRKKGV